MDLFKIDDIDTWTEGKPISGYDDVTWVERYSDAGEFQIKARLSSGLRELLPLGSVISHINTLEMMIVENHGISENVDTDPELTISGRSLETYLENRVIGQNQRWDELQSSYMIDYTTTTGPIAAQLVTMINEHITLGALDDDITVPLLMARSIVPSYGGPYIIGRIKRGNLYTRVVERMALDDLGIRSRRKSDGHTIDWHKGRPFIEFFIGEDKRDTVTFSSLTGDIVDADYLWSIKNVKNSALVTGKFVETFVEGTETGYDMRVMYVDASDIDGALAAIPEGGSLESYRELLRERGRQALARQKLITLINANVSDNRTFRYRTDFSVGDIVSIDTTFGETLSARVVEYAEIQDANGSSGYPTLSVL
jgi:ReqiPepy6 Gp37-like protein